MPDDIPGPDKARPEAVISGLAHDLKAPLTTMIGYAELILAGGMGEVNPDVRGAVESMGRSGRKLMSLIDDIVTVSRVEAGTLKVSRGPARIDTVARAAVDDLAPEAVVFKRTVEAVIEDGLPAVALDPRHLERVVANLLENALKRTRTGGRVSLAVSLASEEAVARELGRPPGASGSHVELKVEYDGAAITAADLPRIFDRGARDNGSNGGGRAGLGLAVVKGIMDACGGSVKAVSHDRGVRFYMWIPVWDPVRHGDQSGR